MLEFSARWFFWCGGALEAIEADCLIACSRSPTGEEAVFIPALALDDRAKNKALKSLANVEKQLRKIGLEITADTIQELSRALGEDSRWHNFQWLRGEIKNIQGLADKELKRKVFFYVPAERAKFFPQIPNPHLFGDLVASTFPSAAYDIAESGRCLALGRGTACVFHLMRILEIGLTVLGKVFEVSLAHTNWAPAIEQLERNIREMHKNPTWKALPDCKEQQEFYAQAAAHFGVLKDAWRNYTMHVRGVYTEEGAEDIFNNTRNFMQKLATRLRE